MFETKTLSPSNSLISVPFGISLILVHDLLGTNSYFKIPLATNCFPKNDSKSLELSLKKNAISISAEKRNSKICTYCFLRDLTFSFSGTIKSTIIGTDEKIRTRKSHPAIMKLIIKMIDGTKYIPLKYANAV